MVLKKRIFFLWILVAAQAWAEKSIHKQIHTGEADFDNYAAVIGVEATQDPYTNKLLWNEQTLSTFYEFNLIESELFSLQKFTFQELYPASFCSHSELDENQDYLRYSLRVLILSYLYEEIYQMRQSAKIFRDQKICDIDWKNVLLKQCHAESEDMKRFVQNAWHVAKNISEPMILSDKSVPERQKQFLGEFKLERSSNVSVARLSSVCPKGACHYSAGNISGALEQACDKDKALFIKICSEKDEMFGVSQQPLIYSMLANSDIYSHLEGELNVLGCLRRFITHYQEREKRHLEFESIIAPLHLMLRHDETARYIQGRLFPAGAMRQFIEKGLTQIFEKKVPEQVVTKVTIDEKPLAKKEVVMLRPMPKKAQKKPELKQSKKKVDQKPKDDRSSFAVASDFRKEYDLDLVKVDMLKFRYDYSFDLKQISFLDEMSPKFISLNGLTQMKENDHLGSREAPMPLKLLKYLIDNEKHQGLYNIATVLGNRFYVLNDVDKRPSVERELIEIKNDESTENTWQIFIRKDN